MPEQMEENLSGRTENPETGQEMDINRKLIIHMRDLNHVMRALYEGKASQKRILIMLNEVESITQRDLTMRLGIQPGSASEILSKLEHAGFISRTMSETDRRTADISLTEKGRQAALEAAQQRSRRHVEMFSCLTEGEKTELLMLLEKLSADWSERYGAAAAERRGRYGHCGRSCQRDGSHGSEGEEEGGFENGHHHGHGHGHGHGHHQERHDGNDSSYDYDTHHIETEEPGHGEIH